MNGSHRNLQLSFSSCYLAVFMMFVSSFSCILHRSQPWLGGCILLCRLSMNYVYTINCLHQLSCTLYYSPSSSPSPSRSTSVLNRLLCIITRPHITSPLYHPSIIHPLSILLTHQWNSLIFFIFQFPNPNPLSSSCHVIVIVITASTSTSTFTSTSTSNSTSNSTYSLSLLPLSTPYSLCSPNK